MTFEYFWHTLLYCITMMAGFEVNNAFLRIQGDSRVNFANWNGCHSVFGKPK